MSGIDSAGQKVGEIHQSALQYQQQLYTSVTTGISQLLAGVLMPAMPAVSYPEAPEGASLASLPSAPGLPAADVVAPTAPTAPSLVQPEITDVTVPVFNAVPPEIAFPTFDDIVFPESPGEAPVLADVDLPADPDVTLPDAPSLSEVDVPAMPSLVIPQFEGVRPTLPAMDTPGQVFVYNEGQFESPLWDALQGQLVDDLLHGGNVSAILETAGIFAQQERWIVDERERKKEEVYAEAAARGFERLSAVDNARIRLIEQDAEKSLEALLNQITAKKAELTVQNRQFVIEKALAAVVGVCLDVWNSGNNRALEAAKATVAAAYQDVDARVALFNCQVAAYNAEAAVLEARIRASLSELEAYKTAMEGARVRGELNQQEVALYVARVQAVGELIQIYKARMEGAAVKAEVQKARIQAYETSVQAFAARVNASTAQINARVARITGEKAKADVFEVQARAFQSQVEAAAATARIGEIRANIAGQLNASNVNLFQAEMQGYQAVWQGRLGQAEAVSRHAANLVALHQATISGVSAENQAKVQNALARVQQWSARLEASIKEAGLSLQWGQAVAELRKSAAATAAQVAGQGFASAGAMVHAAVSLGASYGDTVSEGHSVSESTQTSTSTSTQRSTSYGESKNYNYTASV